MRADRREIGEQFGRNLREARGWAGMTQKELAQRTSISQARISQLECGWRVPRLDLVVTLARPLDVRLCDLLDGIE